MATRRNKTKMTDEHKAALATGREQSRAVRAYLEALDASKPQRGRHRDPDRARARLQEVQDEIPTCDALDRLLLIQERMDLTRWLADYDAQDNTEHLAELEAGFIEAAAGYSERKGISYAAWRELGIPPALLRKAGVTA